MTVSKTRVPFLRRFTAAIVSALIVAIVALAAVAMLLFAGSATNLFQLIDFFLGSTLVAFVVLAVFALAGIYRTWYLRLAGGLLAGVIGGLLGSAIGAVASGAALPTDIIAQLFGTLIGANLPFVVAVTILTMTVGLSVWRRIIGSTDDGERRVAFVRPPADNLADGQVTHIERSTVDVDLANTQWDGYVATLANAGWEIVEVPVASEQADSVFVEDALVVFGDRAVIGNPGAESRRGEIAEAEKTAKEFGLSISRIDFPGTLDGGDVLKVGKTVYVGRSSRTNSEGIRQLRAIAGPLGYVVVAVPVTKALHLKSTVTALPDGTVIGFAPLVDDPSLFHRFLPVPEAEGAAVVVLSDDTVLMSSSAPRSAELIAELGYRVLTTEITEFEKLEGCVTCLSVRVR
ncbi:MAG: N(G),N(G)-dimethylarginine dimethylaminohydrolase [Microbacteriaceae bacterium]|nr:N(G),N(G)-dimethylarginine dimethylaminohydrolase [Microbacteriaceae bacterium]